MSFYYPKTETPRAKQAFNDYYTMGRNRSLYRLWRLYQKHPNAPTKSLQTIKVWCAAHNWPQRAQELDEKVAEGVEQRIITDTIEMRVRQVEQGKMLQTIGRKMIEKLMAFFQENDMDNWDEKRLLQHFDKALKAISEGANLERLARGEPTQIEDVTLRKGYVTVSPDDWPDAIDITPGKIEDATENAKD